MISVVIRLIALCVPTAICFYIGFKINLSQQVETAATLRNFAAIIFGVMGAWIAIVYPKDLKELFTSNEAGPYAKKITSLSKPAIFSCGALTYTVLLQIFSPAAKQLQFLQDYKDYCLALNYAILGLLSVLLMWSLIACFAQMIGVKQQVDAILKRQKIEDARRSQTQTSSKEDS